MNWKTIYSPRTLPFSSACAELESTTLRASFALSTRSNTSCVFNRDHVPACPAHRSHAEWIAQYLEGLQSGLPFDNLTEFHKHREGDHQVLHGTS
jgi:hypothetical protein